MRAHGVANVARTGFHPSAERQMSLERESVKDNPFHLLKHAGQRVTNFRRQPFASTDSRSNDIWRTGSPFPPPQSRQIPVLTTFGTRIVQCSPMHASQTPHANPSKPRQAHIETGMSEILQPRRLKCRKSCRIGSAEWLSVGKVAKRYW